MSSESFFLIRSWVTVIISQDFAIFSSPESGKQSVYRDQHLHYMTIRGTLLILLRF
jgi:hypothetical protein